MDDIILRNKPGMRKNTATPPLVATDENRRGGGRASEVVPEPVVGLLFAENFDDQPDWTPVLNGSTDTTQRKDTHTIPDGWDSIRHDPAWSPSKGHPDRHETIEILTSNADKSRSGTGKSAVMWRDASTPGWVITDGEPVSAEAYVIMRHRASSEIGATKTTEITISGITYSFSSTTSTSPTHSDPDRETLLSGPQDATSCAVGEIVESGPFQISGGGDAIISGGEYMSTNDITNWPSWLRWNSESVLSKIFPEDYQELYAEFWIRFDPNWTRHHVDGMPAPTSKIFRIVSWNRQPSEFTFFGGGNSGPIALWDYTVNGFGIRSRHSLRGGPHGDNYAFSSGSIADLPRSLVGSGDLSMPFNNGEHLGWGKDGSDPIIEDRLNGGLIDLSGTGQLQHDQIFGPGDSWTKLGFYVKMNSAPGESDGIYRQWLNDEQIVNITTIPWVRPSEQNTDVGWNMVQFGGNDFFQNYPNYERHEEWYAIDDIVIRTDIPEHLR